MNDFIETNFPAGTVVTSELQNMMELEIFKRPFRQFDQGFEAGWSVGRRQCLEIVQKVAMPKKWGFWTRLMARFYPNKQLVEVGVATKIAAAAQIMSEGKKGVWVDLSEFIKGIPEVVDEAEYQNLKSFPVRILSQRNS